MHREPQPQSSRQQTVCKLRHQQLGAIIDAQGREIPITEQMILQACRRLEQDAKSFRRRLG